MMSFMNSKLSLGFKGKLILMVAIVSSSALAFTNWFTLNLATEQVNQTIYNEIDHSLTIEINQIESYRSAHHRYR